MVTNDGHNLLDSVHFLESLLSSPAGWIQHGGLEVQDALGLTENWENLSRDSLDRSLFYGSKACLRQCIVPV